MASFKTLLLAEFALAIAMLPCFTPLAVAQQQRRQSVEIGTLAQTTGNKVTGPYRIVYGPSSVSFLGVNHHQVFAGPFMDYTWTFARSLSIEGRAAYLSGKQPIASTTGGSALLMTAGLRATTGSHRARFYALTAPGFVSFSQAGTGLNSTGYTTSRITHFALDQGGGVEVKVAGANALRFDVSNILYVEGGESLGTVGALHWTAPGKIEDHIIFTAGLAHYFGRKLHFSALPKPIHRYRNEATLSFALQRQEHLAFTGSYLNSDTGLAVSAAHSITHWLGISALAVVLPGGDAPNFQDGGTETELLGGVRIGVQRPRYGLFAAYRMGTATFASTVNENVASPPPVRTWDYATDASAIVEYYPHRGHFFVQFDAGQQYTFYHSVTVKEPSPENSAVQPSTDTWSPLVMTGFGWRF